MIAEIQQGKFDFICVNEKFEEVFSIPPEADTQALSDALCNVIRADNPEIFAQEILASLNIPSLLQKVLQSHQQIGIFM